MGGHLSKRQRQVEWSARRSENLPQAADWVNLPRPGCCVLLPYSQGCVELGTIIPDLRRISSKDSVRGEKRGQVDGSRDHSGNLQWEDFPVRQGVQILQAIIILQKERHYG